MRELTEYIAEVRDLMQDHWFTYNPNGRDINEVIEKICALLERAEIALEDIRCEGNYGIIGKWDSNDIIKNKACDALTDMARMLKPKDAASE